MLLSPPHKVQRRNGTKVRPIDKVPARIEFQETGKLLLRKEFLLL
jgi:hypothetical protein